MRYLFTILVAALLTGCSTTYVTSSWNNAPVKPVQGKKIVVIGLVGDNEKRARELMEQHMVGDLKAMGYDAVCSCEEYNPAYFKSLDEKAAIEKLKKEGVETILTIVLLDKRKEKHYVPGNNMKLPVFWDYYHSVQERIQVNGYYTEDTRYTWETNLYDLVSNQLLFSARSQSFEPKSTDQLAHEYGRMLVKKMTNKGVLVKQ